MLVPCSLGWGHTRAWLTRKNTPFPTGVIVPNLVILGQMVQAYKSASVPPIFETPLAPKQFYLE